MVLRYTQAFEVKQVHKMLIRGQANSKYRRCVRCGAIIPHHARFCPSCGLRLEQDAEELVKMRKDKEELKKQLLRLLEEIGIERLKKTPYLYLKRAQLIKDILV